MTVQVGDRVRVLRSRVHPHEGTAIKQLPVYVRVAFVAGGYGGVGYIEDIHPDRLEIIQDHKTKGAPATATTTTKGN